jgi:hypothetical protein
VRESVDITRLSHMVRENLNVDQENTNAETGDVNLPHADVEVDFHVPQQPCRMGTLPPQLSQPLRRQFQHVLPAPVTTLSPCMA